MKSQAAFSEDKLKLLNMEEILAELLQNPSTHGDGPIYGAPIRIDYDKALSFILNLQRNEYTPYGPFVYRGTNCSRFVSSAIRKGNPVFLNKLLLRFPPMLTPTTMWNLVATRQRIYKLSRLV